MVPLCDSFLTFHWLMRAFLTGGLKLPVPLLSGAGKIDQITAVHSPLRKER